MHDGMPYGWNQGQGQGHSREVDRQSRTGLIFNTLFSTSSGVDPGVTKSVVQIRCEAGVLTSFMQWRRNEFKFGDCSPSPPFSVPSSFPFPSPPIPCLVPPSHSLCHIFPSLHPFPVSPSVLPSSLHPSSSLSPPFLHPVSSPSLPRSGTLKSS